MKWLTKAATEAELTLTVCTGAMALGKAVEAGMKGNGPLSDPDLENVRKDARFQKLAMHFK